MKALFALAVLLPACAPSDDAVPRAPLRAELPRAAPPSVHAPSVVYAG